MGMYDTVVVLDEVLRCPHGHAVSDFQTKSFEDPSMDVYLFDGPRVHRVARRGYGDAEDTAEHWRLEGDDAVFERRHSTEAVAPPGEVVFYTSCDECAPVLVRHDRPQAWGDLVNERRLWVEFRATFHSDGRRRIERTSGTRDELAAGSARTGYASCETTSRSQSRITRSARGATARHGGGAGADDGGRAQRQGVRDHGSGRPGLVHDMCGRGRVRQGRSGGPPRARDLTASMTTIQFRRSR